MADDTLYGQFRPGSGGLAWLASSMHVPDACFVDCRRSQCDAHVICLCLSVPFSTNLPFQSKPLETHRPQLLATGGHRTIEGHAASHSILQIKRVWAFVDDGAGQQRAHEASILMARAVLLLLPLVCALGRLHHRDLGAGAQSPAPAPLFNACIMPPDPCHVHSAFLLHTGAFCVSCPL